MLRDYAQCACIKWFPSTATVQPVNLVTMSSYVMIRILTKKLPWALSTYNSAVQGAGPGPLALLRLFAKL